MTDRSESRKKAIRRLKIISGQISGLIRLIEEEDCDKLITQVKATKSAFNGFSSELMKNMLSECLYNEGKNKNTSEKIELEKINEIITKFTSL